MLSQDIWKFTRVLQDIGPLGPLPCSHSTFLADYSKQGIGYRWPCAILGWLVRFFSGIEKEMKSNPSHDHRISAINYCTTHLWFNFLKPIMAHTGHFKAFDMNSFCCRSKSQSGLFLWIWFFLCVFTKLMSTFVPDIFQRGRDRLASKSLGKRWSRPMLQRCTWRYLSSSSYF